MRLWSIHPSYLDRAGLTALWREGLLAKKVLEGNTKGYRSHPQLNRFRSQPDPISAVDEYLYGVFLEAKSRGYKFDAAKCHHRACGKIQVASGQIEYEFAHLLKKLKSRDPAAYRRLRRKPADDIAPHPLFTIVKGNVEEWERLTAQNSWK